MRIVSGKLKSRRFSVPKGFPSRPTTDFAKEGLFNMLENRLTLQDLSILDLCAGTGNISLEFASREAGTITAVESHFSCVKFIQKMIDEHQLRKELQVYKADVRDFLKKTLMTYDLIFADPPYDVAFHKDLVEIIFERKLLSDFGLCIIEHGRQTDLSAMPYFTETRKFGNVHFSFFKWDQA